jgi:hypothetical protein
MDPINGIKMFYANQKSIPFYSPIEKVLYFPSPNPISGYYYQLSTTFVEVHVSNGSFSTYQMGAYV